MIIDIPLQINEAAFEEKIRNDYENKVEQLLLDQVVKVLKEHDDRYYRRDREASAGLANIVYKIVGDIMEQNRAEIIEAASDKLAERLSKTKKAKEILQVLGGDGE